MTEFSRDIRLAVRNLLRNRGFASLALITLALGIGANVSMFSLIRAVLLEPLPFRAPEELVVLWTTIPRDDVREGRSAFANVEDWRAQSRTLADVAVYDPSAAILGASSGSERVPGAHVSPNLFSLLGASPSIGRTFTVEESELRERVVVLSDALWRSRFGSDRSIVGQRIVIDGALSHVVGVMPAEFRFPSPQTALWEPHTLSDDWSEARTRRGTDVWQVVGRLTTGAHPEDAQSELDAVARRLEATYPENRGLGVRVLSLGAQLTGGRQRTALWVLWGAVGFVLVIACANVAGLLLARGVGRRREMAVRTALGAGKAGLVRFVITESLLLGLAGAALGTGLAVVSLELLPALGAAQLLRGEQVSADGVVLAFALALALVTSLVCGIVPGLDAWRPDVAGMLGEGGRSSEGPSRRRVREGLVVAELALAVITLTGSGLMIRSLARVVTVDPGFDVSGVLYAQVVMPRERSPADRALFYRQVVEGAAALDGVEAAGAVDDLFISSSADRAFTIEGRVTPGPAIRPLTVDEVTPDFFRAMAVPLLRGRAFTEQDRADGPPVAIVNESMARMYWEGRDPIGRRVQLGPYRGEGPWLTVVGVVADFRRSGPERGAVPQLFRPHAQQPSQAMNLVVRTKLDEPLRLAPALRALVTAADPAAPVYGISTLEDQLGGYASQRRFQARLLSLFALMAVTLAAIGVYGLVAQSVQGRTRELGVRVALGANRVDIAGLVIRKGMLVTAMGLTTGLAGALAVTHLLRGLLFEVSPADPLTLGAVSLVLAAAGVLGGYVPARRATGLDPVEVLRSD